MSYKVKPEDISADARAMIVNAVNNADRDLESKVAAIANALIEAGLVSPPCRILRSRFGVLDKTYLFIDDNDAQAHASPGDSSEHYRGQEA